MQENADGQMRTNTDYVFAPFIVVEKGESLMSRDPAERPNSTKVLRGWTAMFEEEMNTKTGLLDGSEDLAAAVDTLSGTTSAAALQVQLKYKLMYHRMQDQMVLLVHMAPRCSALQQVLYNEVV